MYLYANEEGSPGDCRVATARVLLAYSRLVKVLTCTVFGSWPGWRLKFGRRRTYEYVDPSGRSGASSFDLELGWDLRSIRLFPSQSPKSCAIESYRN
jgi:hypothetical protein